MIFARLFKIIEATADVLDPVKDVVINHNEHVKEDSICKITNEKEFNEKFETEENEVQFIGNDFVLMNHKNQGTFIGLKEKVPLHDFSIEFTLKNINPYNEQKSAIYIWLTESDVIKGSFLNGSTTFYGGIFGIEFTENKINIVYTINHMFDYEKKENIFLFRDLLPYSKLKDLEEFKVKIINTKNHLKFEIYDGENLISDTFKIRLEKFFSKRFEKNFNVSMTSVYNAADMKRAIRIRDIQINNRKELEQHNSMLSHTLQNNTEKHTGEEEIKYTLAKTLSFNAFIETVLGSPGKSKLYENYLLLQDLSKELIEKQMEIIGKNKTYKWNLDNISYFINKIDTVDSDVKKIEDDISKINTRMEKLILENENSFGGYSTVIIFSIFFSILIISKVAFRKFIRKFKNLKD